MLIKICRTLCGQTLLATSLTLLALPALADFHFQNRSDAISAEEMALAAEITAFLQDYEAAYNNQNYKVVKSMWSGDGNPIYMAEEVPFPLYGEERLNNYFNPVPGKQILEGIDNRYSEVRAKYIAPDVAVATYRLDYDIKLMGMPASHGWNRIMAVFVRQDGNWKMSAYTEAPMGPASMVRKMMKATPAESAADKAAFETTSKTIKALTQSAVSPGFAEFLEDRKEIKPVH